jgi:ribonuclease HI
MYFDGSKRVQGAGAGVVLVSPEGDKLKYILRMSFSQASNNEAEYEALLHGMKMTKIFGDSNHCDAISDNMTTYRNLYYYLEGTFDRYEVPHISRQVMRKSTTWQTSSPNVYPCYQESSGKKLSRDQ